MSAICNPNWLILLILIFHCLSEYLPFCPPFPFFSPTAQVDDCAVVCNFTGRAAYFVRLLSSLFDENHTLDDEVCARWPIFVFVDVLCVCTCVFNEVCVSSLNSDLGFDSYDESLVSWILNARSFSISFSHPYSILLSVQYLVAARVRFAIASSVLRDATCPSSVSLSSVKSAPAITHAQQARMVALARAVMEADFSVQDYRVSAEKSSASDFSRVSMEESAASDFSADHHALRLRSRGFAQPLADSKHVDACAAAARWCARAAAVDQPCIPTTMTMGMGMATTKMMAMDPEGKMGMAMAVDHNGCDEHTNEGAWSWRGAAASDRLLHASWCFADAEWTRIARSVLSAARPVMSPAAAGYAVWAGGWVGGSAFATIVCVCKWVSVSVYVSVNVDELGVFLADGCCNVGERCVTCSLCVFVSEIAPFSKPV